MIIKICCFNSPDITLLKLIRIYIQEVKLDYQKIGSVLFE